MAKMSVQVQNRSASAAHVVSSLEEHGEAVIQGLLVHNRLLQPGQQISADTMRAFMRWLAAVLESKTESMVSAEMAYVDEQADDPAVRVRRDEATSVLVLCMTRVRSSVSAVLGDTGLATYGLVEQVPRSNPGELAAYARVSMNLFLGHPHQQDDGIGGRFDTEVLAGSIAVALSPLAVALQDLRTEQRQLEGAMLRRDDEVTGWQEIYVYGATTFSSLYRIAGHPGLAARVRPTSRRTEGRDPTPGDDAPVDATPVPEDPGTAPGNDDDAPAP
jgi:hypothetical protein